LLLLAVLVAGGCADGEPLVAVEASVQLDGRPLDRVLVCFVPDEKGETARPSSQGVTDAAGQLRLQCEGRDGAVAGWHRVILEDLAPYAGPRKEDAPPASTTVRVPVRYRTLRDTPLRVEVVPGGEPILLKLD
jgi:hypothetical protein